MNNPNLKQAVCIAQDINNFPKTERYVVETRDDLNAFLRAFPRMNMRMLVDPVERMIDNGSVVLFSDPNHLYGYNTYCSEHKNGLMREYKLAEINEIR